VFAVEAPGATPGPFTLAHVGQRLEENVDRAAVLAGLAQIAAQVDGRSSSCWMGFSTADPAGAYTDRQAQAHAEVAP